MQLTELQQKYLELLVKEGLSQGNIAMRLFGNEKTPYKKTLNLKRSISSLIRLPETHEFFILQNKVIDFKTKRNSHGYPRYDFDYRDVINKFGIAVKCPLTGEMLDLRKNEFSLDHKIPARDGGTNELDNLQPMDIGANFFKGVLSNETTICIAIKIAEYRKKEFHFLNDL